MKIKSPIVSVPHAGTRSLHHYLKKKPFYHFHQVSLDPGMEFRGTIHIPVRNPVHHAVSWQCFEGALEWKRTSRAIQDIKFSFFDQIRFMLRFLNENPDHKLYKMEDLPRVAGFGPKKDSPIRRALKNNDVNALNDELPGLFDFLFEPEIGIFYARFYDSDDILLGSELSR